MFPNAAIRPITAPSTPRVGAYVPACVKIPAPLARNIYLYARAGEVTIERIHEGEKVGIRITAADKGPGINNLKKVMEDGYSTSGGLGAGLPGVKRLMDVMDIQSSVGNGTVVVVEKWI